MKLTVSKLLARYAQDPELQAVLGQLDNALKSGELADLLIVLVYKDDSVSVATTIEDELRVLGALAVAQNGILNTEGEQL